MKTIVVVILLLLISSLLLTGCTTGVTVGIDDIEAENEMYFLIDDLLIMPVKTARDNFLNTDLITATLRDSIVEHLDEAITDFEKYNSEGMHQGASHLLGALKVCLNNSDMIVENPTLMVSWSDIAKATADAAAIAGCMSGCEGASNYFQCVDACIKAEVCQIQM